ncbi:16S rRNA (guanine(966)-N(2))-methyltransferase RsmD [Alkalicoccobacillus porphyridii]|uniref:16S rRNA (Guanine(966)-N(2))-methyltransferase RsmD n=2 Tax=Alkalicoccobacillus porphyridii TaxID=2597270 RepID=A0A553ZYJ1_9BACI|nr:16S rRNA (guanine(966)-N(2))-methyltransferase RsmD [Alkalicoccobacillus porphyridii]
MVIDVRVISGKSKGITLKAVPGKGTRPTTDKVKESLFNIIGPYFDGGIALDLYAGSGGLGIEGLSRGLESVIFVDSNKNAIHTINANLKAARLTEKSEVYRTDAERALKAVVKRGLIFQFIFLDPPYAKQTLQGQLAFIDNEGILATDGVVVLEYASSVTLPEYIGGLKSLREESYGDTTIAVWGYQSDDEV